ncbi:MAG TPA: hypothetical protein VLM76_08185 [Patescibacteria group bacterium]|nr:hypothetical protein [Patescibacteria group bacterium]
MTTRTETAAGAYERNLRTARELADRIADHLRKSNRPASLDWGDVGDMSEAVAGLRLVADRMFGEGEHAPERQ